MMKWKSSLVFWVFAFQFTSAFASKKVDVKVIYGEDNRLDYYQAQTKWQRLADSTVALFQDSDVSVNRQTGIANLDVQQYGSRLRLCTNERFFDQFMGAFCSGSLVGEDLILTAGHCVTDQADCQRTRFVFDFNVQRDGDYPRSVRADNVYECKTLIAREQVNSGADWALIRLTRKVNDRRPLEVVRGRELARNTALTVVGHPVGLPVKISGGAKVREQRTGYFVANLDTYGGNSGSAVFEDSTLKIAGVLVRGEQDFVSTGSCRASKICLDDGCRGEDVTTVSSFVRVLDQALRQ